MVLHFRPAIKTHYPFLDHLPPQKKRPLHPLPSTPSYSSPEPASARATRGPRRRSSTFSAIASWAAHVQPGSPAALSPRSPHHRSSVTSIRAPCTPFLQIGSTPTSAFTPAPSVCDFKADLTAVGYTSVFLQLPNTPISTTPSLSFKHQSPNTTDKVTSPIVPSSACKPRAFTCLRSLSIIRSRGKSKSACPDSPVRMKTKAVVASAAIVKRKKAKYAMCPPALANELALMQFTDGGNLDNNIKRIMEAQAKATGTVALADVYRDGEGGIWWDRDEQWEYAHLLEEGDESRPRITGDLQWVAFGNTSPPTVGMPAEERRGSVLTQDSDPDPSAIPAAPILSIPSHPRRTAQHLRKPDFLTDVAFPLLHTSPQNPWFPALSDMSTGMKPKGKTRRRPAPLKLSSPGPASRQPINSPVDVDKVRKGFIAASFEPVNSISVTPVTPVTAVSGTTLAGVRPQLVGNRQTISIPWRTVSDGSTSLQIKPKLCVLGLFHRKI